MISVTTPISKQGVFHCSSVALIATMHVSASEPFSYFSLQCKPIAQDEPACFIPAGPLARGSHESGSLYFHCDWQTSFWYINVKQTSAFSSSIEIEHSSVCSSPTQLRSRPYVSVFCTVSTLEKRYPSHVKIDSTWQVKRERSTPRPLRRHGYVHSHEKWLVHKPCLTKATKLLNLRIRMTQIITPLAALENMTLYWLVSLRVITGPCQQLHWQCKCSEAFR